jgi:hypothetical protein
MLGSDVARQSNGIEAPPTDFSNLMSALFDQILMTLSDNNVTILDFPVKFFRCQTYSMSRVPVCSNLWLKLFGQQIFSPSSKLSCFLPTSTQFFNTEMKCSWQGAPQVTFIDIQKLQVITALSSAILMPQRDVTEVNQKWDQKRSKYQQFLHPLISEYVPPNALDTADLFQPFGKLPFVCI